MAEYLIRHPDGRLLADRTSAVFDGMPYRWTRITDRAKRMSHDEALRILEEVRQEEPQADIIP
jgi:hypothetical protein